MFDLSICGQISGWRLQRSCFCTIKALKDIINTFCEY
jgi:hypothetical protein